ncbi:MULTISPECIES: ABC transporter substrate-binding protein [unclassified Microbacterium]
MKTKKTRALAASLAVIISAVALAGCSSGSEPKKDGVIHWLTAHNGSEPTIAAVKKIAADYSKDHPGFKLEIEATADRPSYDQKLRLLASSNELPDMFDADPEPFFKKIVDTGAVVDIGKLYDELGVKDKFFPISLAYPKWDDGSLNLITLNANVEYFWYNTDLFTKAGVEPPKTLSDFPAACDKLKSSGVTPISVNGKDLWPFYRYLAMPAFRATGNSFIDGLKTGKESMSSSVGTESADFLKSLSGCFQEGFSTSDYTSALNLFTSGKAAMYYMGTWELPTFLDDKRELKPQYSYFPMPAASSSDKTPTTDYFANSGIGTAILKDSLTPELKGFLKYFFAHYGDVAFHDFGVIPSIKPTMDDTTPQIYKKVLSDIEGVKTFAKVWDVQLDPNTNSVLGRESTNLLLGQQDVAGFTKAVDDSIAQYKQQNK